MFENKTPFLPLVFVFIFLKPGVLLKKLFLNLQNTDRVIFYESNRKLVYRSMYAT